MTGRVWLVTGANRGLGRAIAEAAARAGDQVLATTRREGTTPRIPGVVEHVLDVRDRDGTLAAVERARVEFGRLDILLNNAGFGVVGAVEEVDEQLVRDALETNVLGPWWLVQAALPVMREQGSGHVVQISTVGAAGTMPLFGLYNASKWALEGMSEALAQEVADQGIRVSIVEPGSIDTEWAIGSMRFAATSPAYDATRERVLGTPQLEWETTGTGGGTPPEVIAAAVLAHVDDPRDERLRLLVGDDAAGAVVAALEGRRADYSRDPAFVAAERAVRGEE
ncbi:short-chain dehydrogenase/reductase [Serinibacter arcticus]|uniref:Short-chain dehydrogenase/reductase n=1 Tax=Serinibacter arcticus TaxID=1655435 RepID=A0A2U1ZW94_9MICO|nr:SDR family NAD(P)-dependent oxidoreductase [Serinibacter arcticus]PWD51249.1 short-chain dehydrogenase/reductase [Serinibacter arcticus]